MKQITFIFILAVLWSAAPESAQQSPRMVAGLPAGPYAVGFHREWVLDATRVWDLSPQLGSVSGPAARPVRIDVWFPSSADNCRRTNLHDYLYAQPPDAYFKAANDRIQRWDENSLRGYAKGLDLSFDTLLSPTTNACLDAPVRPGRYPLAVYSGGWYNRSPDNIALAEYLASFGYVVAEVPLFGAGLWTGDLSSNPNALETQTRDLETAVGAFTAHDWIDRTHVAAMGYSSGGIVALFLAGRHPLIKGLVGLDPSYGVDSAKVLSSSLFDPDKFRVPVLTLRSGHPSYNTRDRSAVLTALRYVDRYTADVGESTHGDFGDDVTLQVALSLKPPGELRLRSTEAGIAAYRATLSAAKLFLDGVLRDQAGALDALVASAGTMLRLTKNPAAPRPK